jgi:hypothetical protein
MAENKDMPMGKAQVDFICVEEGCNGQVVFKLADCAGDGEFQAMCPKCHKPYIIDEALREKLRKLNNLILTLREAEPILGACSVVVATPGGETKIPYALLLTRLNTMLTLQLGDRNVDFHLWIEPASPETFR